MKHQIINQTKKKTCNWNIHFMSTCHHKWKSNLLVAMLLVDSSIPICLGGWHTTGPPARAFPCFSFTSFFSSFLNQVPWTWLEKNGKNIWTNYLSNNQFIPINLMNIERNGYKDTICWYTSYNTTGSIKAFTTHPHPSWSDSLHQWDWWLVPHPQKICHKQPCFMGQQSSYLCLSPNKSQYEPHTECYRMQHLSII